MSSSNGTRVTVGDIVAQVRPELIPLTANFAYFSLLPIAEDETKQYVRDPIAGLPPTVATVLPRIELILTPYLERGSGRGGDLITFDRPESGKQIFSSKIIGRQLATIALAIKEEDLADYHYTLFNTLASIISSRENGGAFVAYSKRLREELAAEVHGEVDEKSWQLKQALQRQKGANRDSRFERYAKQSFEDTLTLYLHGICCDIDVEYGPRQVPSRHLRRRLELLTDLFPPPPGYQVLPDYPKAESARKR